jgi:hypothetical protein
MDEMSEVDRQEFEDHFFSCEPCADDLRMTTAMLQGAKAGFAGTATSGRVLPMVVTPPVVRHQSWYRSAALPWAMAASFAFLTVYQSARVTAPLAGDTASPIALVPVTLRPASRGAEATIPVGSGSGPVSLAVEINDPIQGGEVTFELNSSDGRRVVSGKAPAPAPGSPLLLLMPSWTLAAPMHYILSVHEAGSSGRLLGEYRFAVSAQ